MSDADRKRLEAAGWTMSGDGVHVAKSGFCVHWRQALAIEDYKDAAVREARAAERDACIAIAEAWEAGRIPNAMGVADAIRALTPEEDGDA